MFLTLLVPAGPTLIQTMCYSLHFCPVWEFLESKRHGSCAIPLPGPQYLAWATWREVFREPARSLLESFSIQQCMHLISCLLVFSLSLDMFVRNLRRLHVLWPPRLLKPWNNCHNFVLFFFSSLSKETSKEMSHLLSSQSQAFFFSRKSENRHSGMGSMPHTWL